MPCNNTENGLINEPYLMNDGGRGFTDNRSSSEINREIRQVLDKGGCGGESSYDFKLCLIRNADTLIKHFNKKTFEKNGVYKCSL